MSDSPGTSPSKRFGEGGSALWREVSEEIGGLDATQSALLAEACRIQDRLDALDLVIRDLGAMVKGSMGQDVVNPALTEARGQQTTQYRLLATVRQLAPSIPGRKKPQAGARGAYSTSSTPRLEMESALERAKRAVS